MASDTLQLAQDLIARPSVTPADEGCQALLIQQLSDLGFHCESMNFGEVTNLWARRGTSSPLFTFAGHTDVVPSGPLSDWHSDPFQPVIRDGYLYGRGSADMKSSIAAMVTACKNFLSHHPQHSGSIAFLITSDEEGPAQNGTVKIIEALEARGEKIDWALVGEPSSDQTLGDVIKNGRRGSISATLKIRGVQGHVAYPQFAANPIHQALPALTELSTIEWDQGSAYFPPTSFQISNIHAGTGASNVIPGILDVALNLRYSNQRTAQQIRQRVESVLNQHGLDFDLQWQHSGSPFLTADAELVAASRQAIQQVMGFEPTLSTAGGTSDGRFIAPTGAQVVELGPVNASIHQVNERVRVADLELLTAIYQRILNGLLVGHS